MSQIVYKMKKVLNGCTRKSVQKYNDCDMTNPILEDEFKFDIDSPKTAGINRQVTTENTEFHIYNDYDNLNHPCLAKSNNALRDSTNVKKKRFTRVFRRSISTSKMIDENNNTNNDENARYSGLYDKTSWDWSKQKSSEDTDGQYCEIQCDDENETLINVKPLMNQLRIKSDQATLNKANLLAKFDSEQTQNTDGVEKESKSLSDLRSPESFSSPDEGFHWYLNLINDTILNCIQTDGTLNEENRVKRLNIAKAHFLYARNFYEMRISRSVQMKEKLANTHPCMIVLACLLDSEAVRIEESHVCVCDSYIYLFSTRLKYCAWKSKLFILLKKPKRSSFDRLNLIEDLTNCHKMIQEKSSL